MTAIIQYKIIRKPGVTAICKTTGKVIADKLLFSTFIAVASDK